jgi:hypothetical protein
MSTFLATAWIPLTIATVWITARTVVYLAAAAVSLWSRKSWRRAEARRLMRLIGGHGEPKGS